MKRTKVKSTNLASIGFDEDKRELEVEFQGGRVYTYSAVPKEVFDALMEENDKANAGNTDASVGRLFINLVKMNDAYEFGKAQ